MAFILAEKLGDNDITLPNDVDTTKERRIGNEGSSNVLGERRTKMVKI